MNKQDKTEAASRLNPVSWPSRETFWGVALGNNTKLANLAKRAVEDAAAIIARQAETISKLRQEKDGLVVAVYHLEKARDRENIRHRKVSTDLRTQLAKKSAEVERLRGEIEVARKDADKVLHAVFEVCESNEELKPTNDFYRGRVFEAKRIRNGVGNWFQDEFCGRSFMGEPAIAIDAARAEAGKDGAV